MKMKSGKKIIGEWHNGKLKGNCIQFNNKRKRFIQS